MAIKQITPTEARKILDENSEAIYLDVRSVPEFTQGHAEGAINIPLLHLQSGQMVPNREFQQVVEKTLPKNKKLVVGCKSGGRSQSACQILEQMGYADLSNMTGGFGGSPQSPGWQALKLPVSQDNGDGVSYESLKAKV